MLIEDNETNRYLATFLLEQAGAAVLHARNGRLGVELAQSEQPDLIIMDIQMPEMDGHESARLIRAQPDTAHIPIVGVSSFAMAEDRARALAAGFADYLEKPFEPETFARRILAHLPATKSQA